MVKNVGGNKSKKGARKNYGSGVKRHDLPLSENKYEQYAIVTKILGGANISVNCFDGATRLCVMGGKFRGRNRRDNKVEPKTWVLVGLREWEQRSDEIVKCDLMYVYNKNDIPKLLTKANFSEFLKNNTEFAEDYITGDDNIEFVDDDNEENVVISKSNIILDDNIIDIDDI